MLRHIPFTRRDRAATRAAVPAEGLERGSSV